jgi:hypothetical protein
VSEPQGDSTSRGYYFLPPEKQLIEIPYRTSRDDIKAFTGYIDIFHPGVQGGYIRKLEFSYDLIQESTFLCI